MGKTTFSGPIVSLTGLTVKGVLTSGLKPSVSGMAVTTVATSGAVDYSIGLNVNNFTGAAAQVVTLPLCAVGEVAAHVQSVDTAGGTNTLIFDCAHGDVFEAGSIIPSRTAGAVTMAVSVTGNNRLTFTPSAATTNMMSLGSILFFSCTGDGEYRMSFDIHHQGTGVTGTFTFSTV